MNNRIAILSFCLLSFGLFCCNQQAITTAKSETASNKLSPSITPQAQVATPKWIDAFKDLCSAIETDDVAKQKSYFSFPINADTTQIWYAVYDQVEQDKWPSPLPATFSEADYERYHNHLFSPDFRNGLAKIDIEHLAKDGNYTTPMFNENTIPYYLAVHINKSNQSLQFTLSYAGQHDEQGNYVSEGEYALIYLFKIEDGKSLRFDKMLFAG